MAVVSKAKRRSATLALAAALAALVVAAFVGADSAGDLAAIEALTGVRAAGSAGASAGDAPLLYRGTLHARSPGPPGGGGVAATWTTVSVTGKRRIEWCSVPDLDGLELRGAHGAAALSLLAKDPSAVALYASERQTPGAAPVAVDLGEVERTVRRGVPGELARCGNPTAETVQYVLRDGQKAEVLACRSGDDLVPCSGGGALKAALALPSLRAHVQTRFDALHARLRIAGGLFLLLVVMLVLVGGIARSEAQRVLVAERPRGAGREDPAPPGTGAARRA